jgi:hypothetical protein
VEPMDDRSRRLYDLGRADLDRRYNPQLALIQDPFRPDRHMPHHSLWYAQYLLDDTDIAGAERIIQAALSKQELRMDDPHFGNFCWHWEDEVVIDLNACQFVLEALTSISLERVSSAIQGQVDQAMRLALREADRLDVHWTYTNIYLLDVRNRILGGQILGDPAIVGLGIERLRDWAARNRRLGAPHEFNSPTYAAVQLNALAALAEVAHDPEARALSREMEEFIWRHVAQYWHAPTMQLGGPHSRAYRRDVVGASGYLKVVLYKLLGEERLLARTPYYEGPDAEGQLVVSLTTYHCPPDAELMLREPDARIVREVVCAQPRTETTALITPRFTLGTLTRPYGVGDSPEPWPADNGCIAYWLRDGEPEYGVMYSRYRVNAGRVGESSRVGLPAWLDIWEDGVFRVAQEGPRAIVAYGLMPRGQRPVDSLRLDLRLLGPQDKAVRADGQAWDGRILALAPGTTVVIDDAVVRVGIVPLEPTRLGDGSSVVLWRDGMEIVISIVNYEGPPKVFWEYRSLAGPFWKCNVQNGLCLWLASTEEWADVADFEEALRKAFITDEVEGSMRRIAFGDVELAYDLRALWP